MDDAIKTVFNAGQARANAAYAAAKRNVTIDPITRLEGHGKIDIYLDDQGDVERAYFQVPELRGFEVFSRGRPAEDMPQITSRICGVCPTAHHMASTKALDDLYQVEPTSAGRKIRELVYHTFMLEDHALHVFLLGGPDFIVGPEAPPELRNIVGVIGKVGLEAGKKVIATRRRLRELIAYFGGKVVHPVLGQPGGVSKALKAGGPAQVPGAGQGWRRVRRVDPGRLQADRPGQPRLREADHLRHLHPQNLLHGDGGRAEQGQLLRWDAAGRGLRGQGGLQVRPQGLPPVHRRACGALELHEVHLPQAAGLAGFRGGAPDEHLCGGSPGPAQCRRRHGHAQGAGRLRGVFPGARRQASAPHARHPLGPGGGDDPGSRAHGAVAQRSGDHQPGRPAHPHRRAG